MYGGKIAPLGYKIWEGEPLQWTVVRTRESSAEWGGGKLSEGICKCRFAGQPQETVVKEKFWRSVIG